MSPTQADLDRQRRAELFRSDYPSDQAAFKTREEERRAWHCGHVYPKERSCWDSSPIGNSIVNHCDPLIKSIKASLCFYEEVRRLGLRWSEVYGCDLESVLYFDPIRLVFIISCPAGAQQYSVGQFGKYIAAMEKHGRDFWWRTFGKPISGGTEDVPGRRIRKKKGKRP